MLDWRKAIADLGEQHVIEVHIVSVDNECKELLLLLSANQALSSSPSSIAPTLHCVNISVGALSSIVVPLFRQPQCDKRQFASSDNPDSPDISDILDNKDYPAIAAIPAFLFEPNASIMKAGCFDALFDRYSGLMKIALMIYLFISTT